MPTLLKLLYYIYIFDKDYLLTAPPAAPVLDLKKPN